MRQAGFELRLEWSQFYHCMTTGDGNKPGQYGANSTVRRASIFPSSVYAITAQGHFNHGHSINGTGGSLIQVNTAVAFPGIDGGDRSDIMALYVTQKFDELVSVSLAKFNMIEVVRARPLLWGIGPDTFWNTNLGPVTGVTPPTLNGAQVRISTQPVSYTFMVYDPQDATNRSLFSDLFQNGVTFNGGATLRTSIAGLTGYYGIKGITAPGAGRISARLFSRPAPPPAPRGSWLAGFSFQQYLVEDPSNPARGWGAFGEIDKSDGNPNFVDWTTYFGVGGSSLVPGRRNDRFGIAYFRLGLSNALKDELAPFFKLRDESGVEAFCNVEVTPWLRITGNVQFVRPASGNSSKAI